MDRHKCKLCTRSFGNGRALGGHLKSHYSTHPLPEKAQQQQLINNTIESASSPSIEEEEEKKNRGVEGEKKELVYGLRENPKKSFKVADPGFAFVAADTTGSCGVVQDGESETESRNLTRRRSKRNPKFEKLGKTKKAKQRINNNEYSSPADPEPMSSASDTSPEEEDVAVCLMMLSRDFWMKEQDQRLVERLEETKLSKIIRSKKCKNGFRSLRALSVHERMCEGKVTVNNKIFECPFCFKVFGSGQALGGHKRSHILGSSTPTATTAIPTKFDAVSTDLNSPAAVDEDEYSVVSHA